MKIEFNVHNVTQGPARVPATVEGKETTAIVDCVIVELSCCNPRHGSLTLRFIGDERADAANTFKPGGVVTLAVGR